MTIMKIRSYSELSKIDNFKDRFEYLKLSNKIGFETFGHDRYINQRFYNDPLWKKIRREVIFRDSGCDLGCLDRPIPTNSKFLVHHMNPIDVDDILQHNANVFDPEFLILTSFLTHNAIHYGDETLLISEPNIRTKNDTCPWR